MAKITKADFKANKENVLLIPMYTAILALVYGMWIYKKEGPIWSVVLVPVLFFIAGAVCLFLSMRKTALNREKEENLKETVEQENK